MKVRSLIGRLSGQIIDLPYAAAQNALMAGTAAPLTPAELDAAAGMEEGDLDEQPTTPTPKAAPHKPASAKGKADKD